MEVHTITIHAQCIILSMLKADLSPVTLQDLSLKRFLKKRTTMFIRVLKDVKVSRFCRLLV